MECPEGTFCIGKDDYIILNKCTYSLVKTARQCYKKAVEILKKLSFVGGNVNPCLYVKKSKNGIVNIVLYVDNNLMVRNSKAIDDIIAALKENGLC